MIVMDENMPDFSLAPVERNAPIAEPTPQPPRETSVSLGLATTWAEAQPAYEGQDELVALLGSLDGKAFARLAPQRQEMLEKSCAQYAISCKELEAMGPGAASLPRHRNGPSPTDDVAFLRDVLRHDAIEAAWHADVDGSRSIALRRIEASQRCVPNNALDL